MIHYALRCSCSHEFDGWFKDSKTFERLAARQAVVCPVCDGTDVVRALMAPAVSSGAHHLPPMAAERVDVPIHPPAVPEEVRRALHTIRSQVERNCQYVGPDFAREARRIHRGERDVGAIYGEATTAQAESLAEEGIEVVRIPWLPPAH